MGHTRQLRSCVCDAYWTGADCCTPRLKETCPENCSGNGRCEHGACAWYDKLVVNGAAALPSAAADGGVLDPAWSVSPAAAALSLRKIVTSTGNTGICESRVSCPINLVVLKAMLQPGATYTFALSATVANDADACGFASLTLTVSGMSESPQGGFRLPLAPASAARPPILMTDFD